MWRKWQVYVQGGRPRTQVRHVPRKLPQHQGWMRWLVNLINSF